MLKKTIAELRCEKERGNVTPKNRDLINQRQREYRAANREEVLDKQKEYRKKKGLYKSY